MSDNDLSAKMEIFDDGEMIFSEFEKGDCFYLIQTGKVELVKIVGDVRKTLDVLGPSEMFGEMALLEDSPRSASAIALGTVKVMIFDKSNFTNLMLNNPGIVLRLLKIFAKRIYDAKRRISTLTIRDTNARISDVLIMLCEKTLANRPIATQERYEIETTIEEIARWAALDVITTQNDMRDLAQKGIIENVRDKIIIKNASYLTRLVNLYHSRKQLKE